MKVAAVLATAATAAAVVVDIVMMLSARVVYYMDGRCERVELILGQVLDATDDFSRGRCMVASQCVCAMGCEGYGFIVDGSVSSLLLSRRVVVDGDMGRNYFWTRESLNAGSWHDRVTSGANFTLEMTT